MYEQEVALANGMADRAAEIALSYFRTALDVRRKADLTPVTEADLRIEALVREMVAERFPDDGVLGEEGGLVEAGGRLWVVDPIDGTKNFVAGIQVWGTLIALLDEGRPVVALVSAPALGERYEAVRGEGARMNGNPIRVSDVSRLAEALVVFAGLKGWRGTPYERPLLDLAAAAARTRGFGDFWGHMLVARGAAEVMVEPRLRTWDTAAVQLIVEEAGGRMTAVDGAPLADGGTALTTNGLLHEEVVRRFREADGPA